MPGSFNPPTITGAVKRITENYSFRVPEFDSPGWGRSLERNFDVLDAVIYAVSGFSNVQGIWDNDTLYNAGERAVDGTSNTVWQCAVTHTSASTGTFAEDRAANPTYWTQFTSAAQFRGDWTTATAYNPNEYVSDSGRFGVVITEYVSGASYNDDVSNGDIITLLDTSGSTNFNEAINGADAITPVDGDEFGLVDVSDSNNLKKTLWSTVKSTLKAYFDPLYHIVGGTDIPVADGGTGASTAAAARTNLGLAIGSDIQAYSAVLAATTASFTTSDESKLDGIESGAQVTSASHVGTAVSSGGEKTAPIAADRVPLLDSAASWALKYITITNLANRIKQIIGGKEIGEIYAFAGSVAPSGSVLCYGQAISRTVYSQLFTAIGTTYGVGDGSTTFNVPDCRGRVDMGKDNMGGTSANRVTNLSGGLDGDILGATGGSETHTLTLGQLPQHDHKNSPYDQLLRQDGEGTVTSIDNSSNEPKVNRSGTIQPVGNNEAHNNIQPSIVFNKCIYTGVYS